MTVYCTQYKLHSEFTMSHINKGSDL